MDEDLAEVLRLELLLLEPEVRKNAERVLRLLHADFYEYGASGRIWNRESVAKATTGTKERIVATNLEPRRLGPDAILVTYASESDGRRALRSSTWVRDHGSWLLLFHQGTLVAE